jgi:flagellar hook-basal body complex protein FliE
MAFSIPHIGSTSAIEAPQLDPGSKKAGGGFGAILEDAMGKVGGFNDAASKSVGSFLSGEGDDLHKTIMATQRAELAMELFLQVRNKVVQAYQEVMRMQV